ncbi:ABC-type nitrate/sulfonate/bicarbonate transport systems, periplasmic component [Methanosarcina barkeri 3]|uniref:ABC-type nitrate/sulfonate/bicarbonate transport systems, periplasmic component n=1 Tax=Methanosarcina barkeri 3 TaxID=1434107 RepID=A0A0E3SG69_METBA|nr:ABC transporter substrate-binding protein [Methanosarcina barkeri]AKB81419.1 ABC-type nitrate/sulfonate/bicarbonate transport systems, periplasmic component [Methanosarcina barkeri 3]
MDKKYIFGIFIALITFAGISAVLLNQVDSSNSGGSQEVNTSIPAEQSVNTSTNTSTSELKTVRHGYLPSNGDALIFIAKEEGFWTEEGLNVELYQFTKGTEGYNSLFGNKLDTVGAGTSDPATYIAQGADITIIGGLMSEGQFLVTAPENSKALADLNNWKGKKIATITMSNGDLIYKSALKKAGIDWKNDVTFLELGSPNAVLEAVKTGKADGGIIWIPYEILAQQQGLSIASYSYQYYDNHPCCRIALKTGTLNKDRNTYVKFEKGLIRAYKLFSENENKSVDDIQKYVKVDKEAIRQSTWSNYFYASPDPNTNGVKEYYQMMKDSGYIDTDVKIEDHIDNTVYKEALEELIAENPDDQFYQKLLSEYKEMNT